MGKSFEVHVFEDRDGELRASFTRPDGSRTESIRLCKAERDTLSIMGLRASGLDALDWTGAVTADGSLRINRLHDALLEVGKVPEYGARKYAANSWGTGEVA